MFSSWVGTSRVALTSDELCAFGGRGGGVLLFLVVCLTASWKTAEIGSRFKLLGRTTPIGKLLLLKSF